MEAQVQQLITNLNGKRPNRADVIKLLELIKDEEDKLQWVELFGGPKLSADINSYPQYNA